MIQQHCRNCGAPIPPGNAVCASCGMPLQSVEHATPLPETFPEAPASSPARPPRPPTQASATPPLGRPRRRRGWLYALLGVLLIVLIVIVSLLTSVIGGASATQQPPTTGAHIISIQTGTGFDTGKALVTGTTRSFKTGQAVFVVFTVKTQDPNAQIVLKLFHGGTLESTSDILTPDVGTNTYALIMIVHSTGAHSCQLDYDTAPEASISFNVTS
jgi:zinc-ribbon domain